MTKLLWILIIVVVEGGGFWLTVRIQRRLDAKKRKERIG